MGMSLLRKIENPDAKFDLYFLGYRDAFAEGLEEGDAGVTGREGILELTYNCTFRPTLESSSLSTPTLRIQNFDR